MTSPPTGRRRDDPRMQTAEMAALTFEEEDEVLGSGPVQPPLGRVATAGVVAAGGAVGSILRYTLTLLMPSTMTLTLVEIPWGTLTANILGCLSLGILAGVLEENPDLPRWVRPAVAVGLLGGFTTYSTVVLEGTAMLGADFPRTALAYALVTGASALVGILLGLAIGRIVTRVHRRHRIAAGLRPIRTDAPTPSTGVRLPRVPRPSESDASLESTPGPRTERRPDPDRGRR